MTILIAISFPELSFYAQIVETTTDTTKLLKDTTHKSLPPELLQSIRDIVQDSTNNYSDNTDEGLEGLDLGLFVVNNTRTRTGAEFFDKFYLQLTSFETDPGQATVIVDEEPFRARTTRLIVKVNDAIVIQTILRPNSRDFLDRLVSSAVQRVNYYIKNYKDIQESLNGEDLSGSGIY